jgi:hypothetical protein
LSDAIVWKANLRPARAGGKRLNRKKTTNRRKIDMKRSQQIVAVAVAGLMGMSALASSLPDGYSSVKMKLTVTMQAASTTSSSSVKFNTTKIKVTNKEMLNLIASQWDMSFGNGTQLVLNNIWSGTFSVLNKDGLVLISNASSDDNGWSFYTRVENYVYTGKGTKSSVSYKYDAIAYLSWTADDGTNSDYFEIFGQASIKDSGKESSGSKESFKLSGASNGQWDGDNAVVSGTVSGKGKNNVPLGG